MTQSERRWPPKPLTDADLQATVDLVARLGGNKRQAAADLGIQRSTLRQRIIKAGKRGIKARVRVPASSAPDPEAGDAATALAARLADQLARQAMDLRQRQADIQRLQRRVFTLEDLRQDVLGLAETPLRPPKLKGADIGDGHGRTVILHLSDVHKGERVDGDQMDGLNAYNRDICAARMGRFFEKAAALMTKYWHGDPPERVVLCLGGDLVSGEIHEELSRTNDLALMPSILSIAEDITAGLAHLRAALPAARIDVPSVVGNHGRLTRKPEAKDFAGNSADMMAAMLVERQFAGDDQVRVYHADGPDALLDIYGRQIVLTHGDRIGSRGGQGYIGPIATILRGMRRVEAEYAGRGVVVYRIMVGHFHTSSSLASIGYSNGSLVGPSEYGRAGRMDMEPPQQNMITLHAERGVIAEQRILVGDPSEGSICA